MLVDPWEHPDSLSEEQVWRQAAAETLQEPAPTEIVGKVLGRDTLEADHPPFQSAVVGVDVLDGVGPVYHPNPSTEVDGLVSEVELLGQGGIDGAAVGAQDDIGVQYRLQDSAHRLGVRTRQNGIGGRRGPVAGNQHRDLFFRQPPLGRLASPLACGARQIAAAFERFQEVGLVRFHDAVQM